MLAKHATTQSDTAVTGESLAEKIHNAVTVQEAFRALERKGETVTLEAISRHVDALHDIARELDAMGCVRFETASCFAQLSHDAKTAAVGRVL